MNSKQINARAKAAGGYVTVPVAGKNYVAEAFYHHAMVAEFDKMLAAVQRLLKKHYTTIRMQNAPFQASSDQRVNAERLMRYILINYQPKPIRNSQRIITKYLSKGRANRRDSILKALRKLYKDTDFTINEQTLMCLQIIFQPKPNTQYYKNKINPGLFFCTTILLQLRIINNHNTFTNHNQNTIIYNDQDNPKPSKRDNSSHKAHNIYPPPARQHTIHGTR